MAHWPATGWPRALAWEGNLPRKGAYECARRSALLDGQPDEAAAVAREQIEDAIDNRIGLGRPAAARGAGLEPVVVSSAQLVEHAHLAI